LKLPDSYAGHYLGVEGMLNLADLRCEYLENPLGIDVPSPRLSWIVRGTGRGQRQSAYQVIAASDLEKIKSGCPDLWDSGTVYSGENRVEYIGKPLSSLDGCWWQVRVWDKDGQPGNYSQPAYFEMGLLKPEDWQAKWIGFPGIWPGQAVYFRHDIDLLKAVRRARVFMAGLGWSELRINGHKVNDRVLDPAQTNYARRILYTTDAVEPFLRTGKNSIGVIAGNGWLGSARLLLQLHLEYEDGTQEVVKTDSFSTNPWVITKGPISENSVFNGEVYDARLNNPDWDNPDIPLKTQLSVAPVNGVDGRLVSATLEPIKVVDTVKAHAITEPKPGIYVFDLGQNVAGWARINVKGESGRRLSLKFAESLYPDGTVNQENLRNARAKDVYILKGEGEECWEPRFTYHGFRYIQVEGYPGKPDAESIMGRVVRSSVDASGTFECSHDLLNRIHQMICWTEADNLHGIPTDCPQRDERMGWLNDMAARTEEALYNFNLVRLLSKWAGDIEDEQDPISGAITDTAPFRWGKRPADPVSICYLLIPWLLYVHYGDRRTMADRYQGMKKWVDFLMGCSKSGIVEYSYYGDWAPPIAYSVDGSMGSSALSASTPGALVSTACTYYSACLLEKMAEVLGKQDDVGRYHNLAEKMAIAYNVKFWDETAGGYGTNNQSGNAISLYMGLVPENRKLRTAASLVEAVKQCDGHLSTGNICTKYLLEALSDYGYADTALAIATRETYPSWGFMLANGATTLWERWELATGSGMNSHNHPMLGSIGSWFYRHLAGIQADQEGPGFSRVNICPGVASGLSWVRSTLNTIRGKIEVAWKIEKGEIHVEITVPVGCLAKVYVPMNDECALYESGSLIWTGRPADKLPEGILELCRSEQDIVATIEAGEYIFHSTNQDDYHLTGSFEESFKSNLA
jgi:alpha-L-rhamnosidase